VKRDDILLIGIAGGSGSGKTTFLRSLLQKFNPGEVALVSQDNYYLPIHMQQTDENGITNFDLPTSIDRKHFHDDILSLLSGRSIVKQEYTFNNPAAEASEIRIEPAPVVVAEGLFIFHFAEIRALCDISVYLDAHTEIRLRRRIARDGEERGYPEHEVTYQWHNHVRPAEELYLEPYKAGCEVLIDNTHSFSDGLEHLMKLVVETRK
jgi:uridine kinase